MKCRDCKNISFGFEQQEPGERANLLFGWCRKINDSPDLDMGRECKYFVHCGPTREQVEKVWKGCRSCKRCRSCVYNIHDLKDMPCKKCDPNAEGILTEYKPSNFCSVCGKPLTDKAVQMVMERLEVLKDAD